MKNRAQLLFPYFSLFFSQGTETSKGYVYIYPLIVFEGVENHLISS